MDSFQSNSSLLFIFYVNHNKVPLIPLPYFFISLILIFKVTSSPLQSINLIFSSLKIPTIIHPFLFRYKPY